MTAAAKDLDLSVLPPEYRVAFEALQATAVRAAELEDIHAAHDGVCDVLVVHVLFLGWGTVS